MQLLLLTAEPETDCVLPALALLEHSVHAAQLDASALLGVGSCDLVLMDARVDPVGARTWCQLLGSTAVRVPVVAVVTEGNLVAVSPEWCLDDVLLSDAGPAEIDARLRLSVGRHRRVHSGDTAGHIVLGELVIDEGTYSVKVRGEAVDLTYKEFELLKYLAQNPGRVFTRGQLLQQVWDSDFFGGPRTVDVHVRRLRAKLGADQEALIGTVRNVGYLAVRPGDRDD